MQLTPAPLQGRLPRTIVHLGWVSFLTDIGSEMTVPVLTLFLASLGAPGLFLGLLEGSAEALVSLMKGFSGWHSDRCAKRVPYVLWGYGLSVLARPLLALAATWPAVFFIRSLDRFGKGLRTSARDALISQAAHPGQRGRAFGYHRSMDTAGAVIGIAACVAWLAYHPGSYSTIFVASVVPGVCAVYLTSRLREPQLPPEAPRVAGMRSSIASLPRSYWTALAIVAVFALANSSDAFLILRAHQLGASDATAVGYYGLYYASYAVLAYPAGVLSDRLGRWRTLAIAWALYAFVYASFSTVRAGTSEWELGTLFCLYGFYMGMGEGVSRALLADFAPSHLQGTAQGVAGAVLGAAALASSLAAGCLWDRVGPSAPFALGAGLAFAALLLVGLAHCQGWLVKESAPTRSLLESRGPTYLARGRSKNWRVLQSRARRSSGP